MKEDLDIPDALSEQELLKEFQRLASLIPLFLNKIELFYYNKKIQLFFYSSFTYFPWIEDNAFKAAILIFSEGFLDNFSNKGSVSFASSPIFSKISMDSRQR